MSKNNKDLYKRIHEIGLKNLKKLKQTNWDTSNFLEAETVNRDLLRRRASGENISDREIYTVNKQNSAGFKKDRIEFEDGKYFVEIDIWGSDVYNPNDVYIKRIDKKEKRGRKVKVETARGRINAIYNHLNEKYGSSLRQDIHEIKLKYTSRVR